MTHKNESIVECCGSIRYKFGEVVDHHYIRTQNAQRYIGKRANLKVQLLLKT